MSSEVEHLRSVMRLRTEEGKKGLRVGVFYSAVFFLREDDKDDRSCF